RRDRGGAARRRYRGGGGARAAERVFGGLPRPSDDRPAARSGDGGPSLRRDADRSEADGQRGADAVRPHPRLQIIAGRLTMKKLIIITLFGLFLGLSGAIGIVIAREKQVRASMPPPAPDSAATLA